MALTGEGSGAAMAGRSGFGNIRKLPSGRYQARYTGPDGRMHKAQHTFVSKAHAQTWLAGELTSISADTWSPPHKPVEDVPLLFGEYADAWLAGRDLKIRTREHYRAILDKRLMPAFRYKQLTEITPIEVRRWYAGIDATRPTIRAHAYALLRTILGTAVLDDLIQANPCRVRGAGAVKRASTTKPATIDEVVALAAAMPAQYHAMILLAAWCALRYGELSELRRGDVDLDVGVVRVRRAVVRVKGEPLVGTPKSTAGVRDVWIPPHLLPTLRQHMTDHVGEGKDALLFAAKNGRNLSSASMYWYYWPARESIGRPDLRFHDLRHTGAVLAASTGATLAELMARLGHSTPQAAMKYQHAAADRDRVIAEALSKLVVDAEAENRSRKRAQRKAS